MILGLIVPLPFLGSLPAAFLPPHARNAAAWLAGLVALACVLQSASLYPAVSEGEVIHDPLAPQFGSTSVCAPHANPPVRSGAPGGAVK